MTMTETTTFLIPTDRFLASGATFSSIALPAATQAQQLPCNKKGSRPPQTATQGSLKQRPSNKLDKE